MCYLKLQNAISGLTGVLQLASFTSTTSTSLQLYHHWTSEKLVFSLSTVLFYHLLWIRLQLHPALYHGLLSLWFWFAVILISFVVVGWYFHLQIKGSQILSTKFNKNFISLVWRIFKDEHDPKKHSRPYVYSLSKDRDRWNSTHSLHCASHKKFREIH